MAEFSVAISPVISYYIIMLKPMVAERAQRTANENTQANTKKTSSSVWQHMCCKYSQHNQIQKHFANNHNTNKYKRAAKTEMRCKYAHTTSAMLKT